VSVVSIPALLAGRDLVEREQWDEAREVLASADLEYVWAHDGMRNLNVRMQDSVYVRFGRAEGDRIADAVYQRMTDWAFGATDHPEFRDQVETICMLWHWHRTPFRLVEDDQKVSYIMQPCGSGGRLVNAGAYLPTATRPLSVLEGPSFASFAEANFPSWCAHCAFSNRGYLKRSIPYFVLEGWSDHRRWGGCAASSYKNIGLVPAEVFERVGLQAQAATTVPVTARVFSDAELTELARPPVDRVTDFVDRRDGAAAIDLIDRSWTAWMNLHSAYRCWYAMFVSEVAREGDAELAAELIDETAWEVVATVLEDPAAAAATWTQFWRNHDGVVEIDESANERMFSVSREALVHVDLDAPTAKALAERLAAGIPSGVRRAGHEPAFGTFRYADGRFEHLVRA
jgi:hypothetical protein